MSSLPEEQATLTTEQIGALLETVKAVDTMRDEMNRMTVELAILRMELSNVKDELESGAKADQIEYLSNKPGSMVFNTTIDNDDLSIGNDDSFLDLEGYHDAIEAEESKESDSLVDKSEHSSICITTRKESRALYSHTSMQQHKKDGDLDEDLFTMMMLSSPLTPSGRMISSAWLLGMLSFVLQFVLGSLVVMDQVLDFALVKACGFMCTTLSTKPYDADNFFRVDLKPNTFVQIAQGITIPLALVTQTDLATSMATAYQLRNYPGNTWHETIGIQEGERTSWTWFTRVMFPNLLKFTEAIIILFASWVVIVQSDSLVELLKDFSALFVISTIDNVLFVIARNGYFGRNLIHLTRKVREAKCDQRSLEDGTGWIFKTGGIFILSLMMGSWGYIVHNQMSGAYFKAKYPDCDISPVTNEVVRNIPAFHFYHNDFCNGFLNNEACGYDGGDCSDFSKEHPDCFANFTGFLGNGKCSDDPFFNTYECGWDLGDCVPVNFPNCSVSEEDRARIGDRTCHLEYNTTECAYDGGDCLSVNMRGATVNIYLGRN